MSDHVRVPWNGWEIKSIIGNRNYSTIYEIERTMASIPETAAMKVISIPPERYSIEDAYSDGYDDKTLSEMFKSYLNETLDKYCMMRPLSGHSNIISCEDLAFLPKEDSIGWDVYVRMECLTPLQKYLSGVDELDEERILKLGKDICRALLCFDQKGIIHLDVKPENIYLTGFGDYKLGLFDASGILDHFLSITYIGRDRFMAPEVEKLQKYDKTVDIYSLGLVLYWLLNGRRMPFLEVGKIALFRDRKDAYSKRLSGEPFPEPKFGCQSFKGVVLKACSYAPSDRYQNAQEMLDALNEVVIGEASEPVPMPPEPELNVEDLRDANSWADDASIYVDPKEKYAPQDEPEETPEEEPEEAEEKPKEKPENTPSEDMPDDWTDDDGTIAGVW